MAREDHVKAQLARFTERGMGRYEKRQVDSILRKVDRLPDESVEGIVEHFLNSCRRLPALEVWDELVEREWRLLRKRREDAEQIEAKRRDDEAAAAAAKVSDEEAKRRMEAIRAKLAGSLRSMERVDAREDG